VAIPPVVAMGRLSIASGLQQKKKQLKDLLGQRKDDSGVLVEGWRLFWAIGGWFCYEVFGF
jgi:hypothetical protein